MMLRAAAIEKREANRAGVCWPVHVEHRGILPRGQSRDVSTSGMFVALDAEQLPPAGSEVRLHVFLTGTGRVLDLLGVVRWAGFSKRHACTGIGIEFKIIAAERVEHPWAA